MWSEACYNTAMNFYNDPATAEQFIDFINAENGLIQRQILLTALSPLLPSPGSPILDAACGTGWFSEELSKKKFTNISAFDASPTLITEAKQKFPHINFQVADASGQLPYSEDSFEAIFLNMASHDLENQPLAFENFYKILNPGGNLVITLANPYYSYPVGVWKRSWLGKIFRTKPRLLLRPYHMFKYMSSNAFQWNKKMTSRFYPLSQQINNILKSGFMLTFFQELESTADSKQFNAQYQLHRFPLILLFKFQKPSK